MVTNKEASDAYNKGKERNGTYLRVDGKFGLIKCPECKRENYMLSVNSGVCYWCKYDANGGLNW